MKFIGKLLKILVLTALGLFRSFPINFKCAGPVRRYVCHLHVQSGE